MGIMIYDDISVEKKKLICYGNSISFLHHSDLFPVSLYSNVYMVKKIHHLFLPFVIRYMCQRSIVQIRQYL